jgi:hypothetical protein
MTNVPNLYLKREVYKALVQPAQSDAAVATNIFRDQFSPQDAPIIFSRMLRGEYAMQPLTARRLVAIINARIEVYRDEHKLGGRSPKPLTANDLYSPLYEFIRHFIEAVVPDQGALTEDQQKFFKDELTRTQQKLFDEFTPKGPKGNPAKLLVERVTTDRFTDGALRSGGQDPVIFDPGSHMGQFSIEGLVQAPIAAYTLIARDPSPECWLWELSWGDTVRWLPSPITPISADGRFNLLPAPQKMASIPGRFLVTTAVVVDKGALAELDPRGADVAPSALDENQTAKFLIEARRLANPKNPADRKNPSVMLATNEYSVVG